MSKKFSESLSSMDNHSDKKSKTDDNLSSNIDKKDIYSKKSNVQQLLARIAQEIDEKEPSNVIHFIVDFLCKHYPEHLHGFEAIWNGDPDLEQDRLLIVEFFKNQKLPVEISLHFINAGFDTLETLCTLSINSLEDVEQFNNTKWLPGHKVRLQQTFNDITNKVHCFKEKRDDLIKSLRQEFISTSPIPNSFRLPKLATPMLLPVSPHVSSPINISTKVGNYLRVTEPISPHFFHR